MYCITHDYEEGKYLISKGSLARIGAAVCNLFGCLEVLLPLFIRDKATEQIFHAGAHLIEKIKGSSISTLADF